MMMTQGQFSVTPHLADLRQRLRAAWERFDNAADDEARDAAAIDLEAADIANAGLLVIATPDSHNTGRIIEKAREANPGIDTLVRTHSEAERLRLEEQGVGLVLEGGFWANRTVFENLALPLLYHEPDAPGLAAAAALGCPTAALPSQGRKRADYDAEAAALLRQYQPDWVVLAGYMRILSPAFIQPFAGRILNIHPADTHQHQGLHAYEWAFDNHLPETKITVHLVDEGLDTGPILAQRAVDLRGADTLEEVERRGLAVEHELYAETLAALIINN